MKNHRQFLPFERKKSPTHSDYCQKNYFAFLLYLSISFERGMKGLYTVDSLVFKTLKVRY